MDQILTTKCLKMQIAERFNAIFVFNFDEDIKFERRRKLTIYAISGYSVEL